MGLDTGDEESGEAERYDFCTPGLLDSEGDRKSAVTGGTSATMNLC